MGSFAHLKLKDAFLEQMGAGDILSVFVTGLFMIGIGSVARPLAWMVAIGALMILVSAIALVSSVAAFLAENWIPLSVMAFAAIGWFFAQAYWREKYGKKEIQTTNERLANAEPHLPKKSAREMKRETKRAIARAAVRPELDRRIAQENLEQLVNLEKLP